MAEFPQRGGLLQDGRWTGQWDPYALSLSAQVPCLLISRTRRVIPITSLPAVSPQMRSALRIGGRSGVYTYRQTAPLGAVSSHMSRTPNSEVSLLWSPGDDSEDFPPSPASAPATPAASAVSAREPPATGTPVGSLLGRVLRREHYSPEILRVVEPVLDPVRSDTTTNRNDSGDTAVTATTPRTATTAPIGVPKADLHR